MFRSTKESGIRHNTPCLIMLHCNGRIKMAPTSIEGSVRRSDKITKARFVFMQTS
jgi:hypothetical protein